MWFEPLRTPISDLRSPSFFLTDAAPAFASLFVSPDFRFQIRSFSVKGACCPAGVDASVRISDLKSDIARGSGSRSNRHPPISKERKKQVHVTSKNSLELTSSLLRYSRHCVRPPVPRLPNRVTVLARARRRYRCPRATLLVLPGAGRYAFGPSGETRIKASW